MKKSIISLYVAHHKLSHVIKTNIIKPIQIGFEDKLADIEIRDNTGDNISNRNSTFCELTAQYWVWKNDLESDYIGFLHYRRYLNFNNNKSAIPECKWGYINEKGFGLNFKKKYAIKDDNIEKVILDNDIILPNMWDVRNEDHYNVRDHFERSNYLHVKDFDLLRKVIKNISFDHLPYFDDMANSRKCYFTNIFIFRRKIFHQYSDWLFRILFEYEKVVDVSDYNSEEKRTISHLAERLLMVWISKYLDSNSLIKVTHLQRIFIEDSRQMIFRAVKKNSKMPTCPVVMASNETFTPHMASLIVSILENSSDKYLYDFIILGDNIKKITKNIIIEMTEAYSNSKIQFLDLDYEYDDATVHMHFSKATFFRLSIDKLLPDYDKVIYLDCDMIVLGDISKLFEIDIKDKVLAATHDYIMSSFCETKLKSLESTGSLDAKKYLIDYLGMTENWNQYFQAGAILFNVKKLRDLNLSSVFEEELRKRPYWFVDQDLLNKYFNSDTMILDLKWNIPNVCIHYREGLNQNQISIIDRALDCPWIIHYAGYEAKPWINLSAPFSEVYWKYQRKTPFYEKVITSAINRQKSEKILLDHSREKTLIDKFIRESNRIFKRKKSIRQIRIWIDRNFSKIR